MYTELIFGARLKETTPKEVIDTIKYMVGDLEEEPENLAFETTSGRNVLRGCSYYFGVQTSVSKFYYDDITKSWTLSSRANIKNYEDEIGQFLNWIKPHIKYGSGSRNMYAVKIYEEENEPTIYYLT
jgi:hypothetical protein